MRVLAIDPGNTDSGWVIVDTDRGMHADEAGKTPNDELLAWLPDMVFDLAVIEMVASYGMPVGAEVFETCVWIGRYLQVTTELGLPAELTKRQTVKLHHCHVLKGSNDATVKQALLDRFALGQPNYGKGTKANPGFFYGFKADIWAAYALAVQHADTHVDPHLTAVHTAVHNV